MTTTSKVSCHFFGMGAASALQGFSASVPVATPAAATAPLVFKKFLLVIAFGVFVSSDMSYLLSFHSHGWVIIPPRTAPCFLFPFTRPRPDE
jgi:hypothetical protein